MLNHVQEGKRLEIYNASPTATLLAGVPVVVSGHIRIPIANISPLSWGEASAEEVFNLPAKASDTWNDGDTLYWDPNNGWLTSNGETAGVVLAGASVPMSVSVAGQQTVTAGKAAGVTTANVELIDHNAEAIIPQATITAPAALTSSAPAAQTAEAAPAGGTGAAAGGWDTAAHRDAAIAAINANEADVATLITELTAVQADVAALRTTVAALRTALIAAGVIAGS
jgi:predicted RecA/RadA family phage recombinase